LFFNAYKKRQNISFLLFLSLVSVFTSSFGMD